MSTSFGRIGRSAPAAGSRWYPTHEQLATPQALHDTLRRVLDLHYEAQDRTRGDLDALAASQKESAKAQGTPQGPATTKLLGLNVEPIDTASLANGATLKFSKSRGTFFFG